MNKATNPEILFQEIWGDLDQSMSSLENGGKLDMVSLDNKVRYFCGIVKELPAQDARSYQKKIEQIINYLNEIITRLTQTKEALSIDIDMADKRQRAQTAYGNARLYSTNNMD